MASTTDVRLRSVVADDILDQMAGKLLTDSEYDLLVSGPTTVRKPDGSLLLVYRPAALPPELRRDSYATLHSLKGQTTTNRGMASGTKRASDGGTRTRTKVMPSAIIGAMDPAGPKQYCRLTAWTGKETERFAGLFPLFRWIGSRFAEEVPDRFAAQMAYVERTADDWVIPGTPFTTITVNNSYPTGVHKDAGDLDEGFSTIVALRQGEYRGGRLVFPKFRVAADLQDGDLILMDAHEWHGNTAIVMQARPQCVEHPDTPADWIVRGYPGAYGDVPLCGDDDLHEHLRRQPGTSVIPWVEPERISVVSYYRTRMVECAPAADEAGKAAQYAEQRTAASLGL